MLEQQHQHAGGEIVGHARLERGYAFRLAAKGADEHLGRHRLQRAHLGIERDEPRFDLGGLHRLGCIAGLPALDLADVRRRLPRRGQFCPNLPAVAFLPTAQSGLHPLQQVQRGAHRLLQPIQVAVERGLVLARRRRIAAVQRLAHGAGVLAGGG